MTTDAFARIRIVLVRPSHPGNIGASARALATMGLARLVLVRPKHFPHADARALASNALEVLDQARVCASLEEALSGTSVAIAMSARARELSHPALDARAAAQEAYAAAQSAEVALVFGSEGSGLDNDEVMKCNRLAAIPANPDYPSLNLAAAVQIMAYEIGRAGTDAARADRPATVFASFEQTEKFFAHLERSLRLSGYLHPRYPRRLMQRLRRLFGRSRLEKAEVNVLRGMLVAWDEKSRAAGKK